MSLQQIKKELAGIREAVKPEHEFDKVIIYDPETGIPEFNDDKTRIFIPDNGRDFLR